MDSMHNSSLANNHKLRHNTDYYDLLLHFQIHSQLNSTLQTTLENLAISNKRILTDYDSTVVHIVAEMESSLSLQTQNHLMRLEIFHLTFDDAMKITANIDEKVILKPSGKSFIPFWYFFIPPFIDIEADCSVFN